MWISNMSNSFVWTFPFMEWWSNEEFLWRHFGCQMKCTKTIDTTATVSRYLSLISEMFLCVKNHFCHTCRKKAAFWYSSHTCVSICTQKQRMGKEGGKMCIVCGVSGPEKMHNISFYHSKKSFSYYGRGLYVHLISEWYWNPKKPREDIGDFSLYVPV